MSHLAMKDELPGLTDEERNIFDSATGYLMRQTDFYDKEKRRHCYYIGHLLRMVNRLANTRSPDKEAAFEWFKDGADAFQGVVFVADDEVLNEFVHWWTEKHGGNDGE